MLDTNVLISIIIFNSNRLKELLIYICDKHKLVLSTYIIRELKEVVIRKFPSKIILINEFLANITYEVEDKTLISLNSNFKLIRDDQDIPILYSAIIANVDILISGDKDFTNINIKKPKIMRPKEFANEYFV